ncbi:DUF2927 domain-containing protein [Aeromonas simiae]|uniref:DUF2927 domain-containing protein n=1 Tax=Aeromonas simiae TaxID=218936 RepID=UPI00266DC344|nr:DUF2927 domain-containing protein [Aeromonas simiae]MDO2948549.1 DUF2927 domain-containing protein [Aeromonas simiae]MDO2951445.1 DUF2927 domain-containing protein [Aeromonas simiae]MDO2955932.1 DUF2927 domain-containing protein [Aeromonas simiae]
MPLLRWLLLFPLLVQAPLAAERWQRDAYLTESFITVALGREYQPGQDATLTRWEQPLRYFLVNQSGDKAQQRELVTVQMAHLARLTGLSIQPVQHEAAANLVVVMTRQAQMGDWIERRMGDSADVLAARQNGLCLGHFSSRGQLGIVRATVLIPTDRARDKGKLLDCVVEELTQVMGLPNDSDRVFPSIFNDRSIDHFLSPLDYLLIRMLYSPGMRSGMNEREVRAALPAILARLRQQGELRNAPRRVNEGSLRQWAGL